MNDNADNPEINLGWFEGFLPRSSSKCVFLFVMTCYEVTLARLIAHLIQLLRGLPVRSAIKDLQPPSPPATIGSILDLLVLAPVIESLVLIALIELCRKLKLSIGIQVAVPGVIISILHTPLREYPFWGLLVAPAFLIDAGTYVFWRRTSFWVGATMMMALHSCTNVLAAIPLIAELLHR